MTGKIECPKCKKILPDEDFVVSKHDEDIRRQDRWKDPQSVTYSNVDFYVCSNCKTKLRVKRFKRIAIL